MPNVFEKGGIFFSFAECWSLIAFMICYYDWLICFFKEDISTFFAALSIDLSRDLAE